MENNGNIIYFLKAIPGSGKSTWVEENNLKPFSISMDTLREMRSGLEINENNELVLNSQLDNRIYNLFKEFLVDRMRQGGPIICDNYYSGRKTYKEQINLAERYGYICKIVEFPEISFETLKERNSGRIEYKRIREDRLKEMYLSFTAAAQEENILPAITPENAVKELNTNYKDVTIDLNKYKKIHHFGDLQGTYRPIKEYFDKYGLKEDEFYIFLGDYVDRGLENDKAIKLMMKLATKENVILIKGNHEIHLENYGLNLPVYSKLFENKTKPQLEKQNIKRRDIKNKLLPYLKDFYLYEYKDKKVFCNHAGLGDIPENPFKLFKKFYYSGFKSYDYDIDTHFTENAKSDWYQLHGHRNFLDETFQKDIDNSRSFSLESAVEFGGKLSVVQLDENGFKIEKINSPLLKEIQSKEKTTLREANEIINETGNKKAEEVELLNQMLNHDFVMSKRMISKPYISSLNFTKEAFYKQEYDEVSVKARGLFINNETKEIVARGYDKFFNIGEKGIEQASYEYLKDNLKGNIFSYIKENGFLGIIGYDRVSDELVFASKSTIESDFAQWFKNIFESTVSEENRERIKNRFKKDNTCAVFEVNDPINDPHIIPYDNPHIVLLDVFKRELETKRLNYEQLENFGQKYGLKIKEKGPIFKNSSQLIQANHSMSQEDPLTTKRQFEGYVVEDENGNMTKIKLPFYNYWKQMRGIKHRVSKYKKMIDDNNQKINKKIKNFEVNNKIPIEKKEFLIKELKESKMSVGSDIIDNLMDRAFFINEEQYPESKKFIEYLFKLKEDELSKDIISLKNDYEKKIKRQKRYKNGY